MSPNIGIVCQDETFRYIATMDTLVNFRCPALLNITRRATVVTAYGSPVFRVDKMAIEKCIRSSEVFQSSQDGY